MIVVMDGTSWKSQHQHFRMTRRWSNAGTTAVVSTKDGHHIIFGWNSQWFAAWYDVLFDKHTICVGKHAWVVCWSNNDKHAAHIDICVYWQWKSGSMLGSSYQIHNVPLFFDKHCALLILSATLPSYWLHNLRSGSELTSFCSHCSAHARLVVDPAVTSPSSQAK